MELSLKVAMRSADYVLRDMTSLEGAFFNAQDPDSEDKEGKFYIFTLEEIESPSSQLQNRSLSLHPPQHIAYSPKFS